MSHQGHQPFSDSTQRYWMVYNGEVFNYIELRRELEAEGVVFRTQADTEVVLQAYIRWGTAAFNRFNGMWAAAIYDRGANRLLLTRDRFGIKPLFYTVRDGMLAFSSESKFLRSFCGDCFAIDAAAVRSYLDLGLLNHSAATFHQGISELEPGHFLTYDDSSCRVERYWRYTPTGQGLSGEDAAEHFASLFEDSLRLRMRSDVEVGTLLSGGLDSNTIVASLDRLGFIDGSNFKTFSAVFTDERFSEKSYIDLTTAKVPVRPYFVSPRPEDVDTDLPGLLHHIEQPFRSLSVYSQYLIYRMVRQQTGVKVVLNGQGADELFGGYRLHYYYRFAELLRSFRLLGLAREMRLFRRYRGEGLLPLLRRTVRQWLAALMTPDFFNAATFRELSYSALREYLAYDDRNAMAFGIEARVPFLDYRLVEFAFSLDSACKIDRFRNKRIVRDYAQDKVPEPIVARTDKMGFISPQEIWQQRELAPLFATEFALIARDGLFDFLDHDCLAAAYAAYRDGARQDWDYIWRIFCLSRWKRALVLP